MKKITILIIILAVIYLLYIICETILIRLIRKSFKYVIHVNGTRGKSTTTRLIDAGLRACGFRVFSKTTGTFPTYIDVDNNDIPIKRWGNANIREQIKMMIKAYRQHAEILVIECMAVNKELQGICEKRILKADICVITNVRMDHLNEMGTTLESIAGALSETIPQNGTLIISEDTFYQQFNNIAKVKNTKVRVAEPYNLENKLNTFPENIALALEVGTVLSLDTEMFRLGLAKYHDDPGAFCKYKIGNTIFYNGFSINDPSSIEMVYNEITKEVDKNKLTIILNSRGDRLFRIKQHLELLLKLGYKNIIVVGDGTPYIIRYLKKYEIKAIKLKHIDDLLEEEAIFAIGNIAGSGQKIMKYFYENGERL